MVKINRSDGSQQPQVGGHIESWASATLEVKGTKVEGDHMSRWPRRGKNNRERLDYL